MILKSRMFGYNIDFSKPEICPYCNKNIDSKIITSAIDNDNQIIKYVLILKCPKCGELFFAKYIIGDANELAKVEQTAKTNPIVPKIIKG